MRKGLKMVRCVTAGTTMNPEQMRRAVRVTDLAIGLTWVSGIVLVVMASWYTSKWCYLKVLVVVVISAIHSIVHRRWKLETEARTNDAIPYVLLVLSLLAVLLVVFKRPI